MAEQLGLAALNGELFSRSNCQALENAFCSNENLLFAIRELSTFQDEGNIRRRVNYTGLDVEEFGSVYESLLDFHPRVNTDNWTFSLVAGSERKQTGSYYTPPELVKELIESALVPVIADRLKGLKTKEAKENALLGLRVCDPAAGSGHFLLAAARRIAHELATLRSDESEPTPAVYHNALRDVVRNCIYAVDKNQLAVDLCKVALWMEGHCAGYPLGFLDHHIKHGDSLVGVFNLKVLKEGIPDGAYEPVSGDNKDAARIYKRRNIAEKANVFQLGFDSATGDILGVDSLAGEFQTLATLEERNPSEVSAKEQLYEQLRHAPTWEKMKNACDLWTAAFFLPLEAGNAFNMEGVPTTLTIRQLLSTNTANGQLIGQSMALSHNHPFFHWQLEFPDVFQRGGFDVVLGNPPWDKIEMQEVEFFQNLDTEIAHLSGSRRKNAISDLEKNNPELWSKFVSESRKFDSIAKFAKESGRFSLTATGRINSFALFAESNNKLFKPNGRMGLIVPTSIGTDYTYKKYFESIIANQSLVSLYDFENRENIFPAVDSRYKFCLFTVSGAHKANMADFAFFLHRTIELKDEYRKFTLSVGDLKSINPNTKTCPVFRSKRDAILILSIYKNTSVLVNNQIPQDDQDFEVLSDLINMTHDSSSFATESSLGFIPLYEGKMIWAYDHRAASVKTNAANLSRHSQSIPTSQSDYSNPNFYPNPEYWITKEKAWESVKRLNDPHLNSLVTYRLITSPTNERTMVASVIPFSGVAQSLNVIYPKNNSISIAVVVANLNSFMFDYITRQKIGGVTLNVFIAEQLPIIPVKIHSNLCPWSSDQSLSQWIKQRFIELTFTAYDLMPFAHDLGYDAPPFLWDINRRFLICCELDAAFFHLYNITREDVDYIMDTFPIVKRKDEEKHGEYRTKRVILEIYEEMAKAIQTGQPYQTSLDPPPGDPRAAHQS
jgi:hypothetical protein